MVETPEEGARVVDDGVCVWGVQERTGELGDQVADAVAVGLVIGIGSVVSVGSDARERVAQTGERDVVLLRVVRVRPFEIVEEVKGPGVRVDVGLRLQQRNQQTKRLRVLFQLLQGRSSRGGVR